MGYNEGFFKGFASHRKACRHELLCGNQRGLRKKSETPMPGSLLSSLVGAAVWVSSP